jgi:hypothetical protein
VAIENLSKNLRIETEKSTYFREEWGKSKQKQDELDNVLLACTMANISTVTRLSSQFDELQCNFNAFRDMSSAIAPTIEKQTKDQEKIKKLNHSIDKMKIVLEEADEKDIMKDEEMDSLIIETEQTRQNNKKLREQLKVVNNISDNKVLEVNRKLEIEKNKNISLENENNILKLKLDEALKLLTKLGL